VDETIIPGHRPIFLDTSSVTRPKTEKPLFATLKKLLEDSTMLANKTGQTADRSVFDLGHKLHRGAPCPAAKETNEGRSRAVGIRPRDYRPRKAPPQRALGVVIRPSACDKASLRVRRGRIFA
jgi:hypothetical protein